MGLKEIVEMLNTDNNDIYTDNFLPSEFMPMLIHLWLDEKNPVDVIEATSKAIVAFFSFSKDSIRILQRNETARALKCLESVIEVNCPTRQEVEQTKESLEVVLGNEDDEIVRTGMSLFAQTLDQYVRQNMDRDQLEAFADIMLNKMKSNSDDNTISSTISPFLAVIILTKLCFESRIVKNRVIRPTILPKSLGAVLRRDDETLLNEALMLTDEIVRFGEKDSSDDMKQLLKKLTEVIRKISYEKSSATPTVKDYKGLFNEILLNVDTILFKPKPEKQEKNEDEEKRVEKEPKNEDEEKSTLDDLVLYQKFKSHNWRSTANHGLQHSQTRLDNRKKTEKMKLMTREEVKHRLQFFNFQDYR